MNVLVTGGAGFIGSHLVEELVKRKNNVTVIDNLSFGKEENLKEVKNDIKFLKQSIRGYLLEEDFDIIYHLAARKSVPQSFKEPQNFFDTNISGTWSLLETYPNSRFVNVSSSSSEFCKSPYAISKKTSEYLADLFENTINIRFYNVFGERQPDIGAVFPAFCNAILDGGRAVIYGDGTYFRDFTYAKDVVNELIKYGESERKHNTVKMGYGESHTISEVFKLISKQLNYKEEPIFRGKREGDVRGVVSEDLIENPEYGFLKGLERTVNWYGDLHSK